MVEIIEDNGTFILLNDISNMSLYQQTKAKKRFLEIETQILENCINEHLRQVLSGYGIIIQNDSESALKSALDTLKYDYHLEIDIEDVLKDRKLYHCEYLGQSKNDLSVLLEDNKILQSAVKVELLNV